jgi:hypothetical protein
MGRGSGVSLKTVQDRLAYEVDGPEPLNVIRSTRNHFIRPVYTYRWRPPLAYRRRRGPPKRAAGAPLVSKIQFRRGVRPTGAEAVVIVSAALTRPASLPVWRAR